jgi:acetyl-CoA acetyltransferase
MREALSLAAADGRIGTQQIDGMVAIPSLAQPQFMAAHHLATHMNILPVAGESRFLAKTMDTGGASPVTALLEADNMIRNQGCHLVAVCAADAIASMNTMDFLRRADEGCYVGTDAVAKSPIIPLAYDRIAQWQMKEYGVTREQLAMVSVLMSRQATRHPLALGDKALNVDDVLAGMNVGEVTTIYECARRADGGAAILLASPEFIEKHNEKKGDDFRRRSPALVGGGEASGPLYPPVVISEDIFSCHKATAQAYAAASMTVRDIDFFGLYDCFPVCFLRAVEAVGLAPRGQGGEYIESMYALSESQSGILTPEQFPVNTHGGLLGFGAPWEVPAMYNIIEAVQQLRGAAEDRQVPNAKNSLVYGNGGIFSASAIAILSNAKS